MHTRTTPTLLILTMAVARTMAADAPAVTGRIDSVVVYRGQALVTRLVDVPGAAGLREVVITGLPERVVPSSLFAEADGGVEVRSLRFRTRPVSEDVREDVRKLEQQIQAAADGQIANGRQQQLIGERKTYLDKLDNFTAPTATAELTRGVLNAETLKALTVFVFEQRKALADEELKLAVDAREMQQQIALLQRQLNDLTRGASKSLREAVIFADFKAGVGPLRVKYLVDSATWSPSYVAKADSGPDSVADKRPVTVQYNASVQQMSGEDWTDVAMTLSTATPSLVAAAPTLEPLTISLAADTPQAARRDVYAMERQKLSAQRQQVEVTRNNYDSSAGSGGGGFNNAAGEKQQFGQFFKSLADSRRDQDAELNGIADKLQVLELQSNDAAARDRSGRVSAIEKEGVSVTYQLPARTSLPSRSDQQSIRIANVATDGEFYKLAMPVLTTYVYDHATVTNPGPTVLLAGPVASYLDGQYVGVGVLPTVAVGEKFTLGFGIDSSLRANRELVDKTETTQGGNRVLTFSYRLAVENFGKKAAIVRVTDRLPTSPDPDVKVTLMNTSATPTTQPAAPEPAGGPAKRTGVISWSLPAAPESLGDKAVTLTYQYKLEFDKQLNIGGLSGK